MDGQGELIQAKASLVRKPRGFTAREQEPHCVLVEGNKYFSAELGAFECDHAVVEVSARVENRKPSLRRRAVHSDICARDQTTDGSADLAPPQPITLGQHPNQ